MTRLRSHWRPIQAQFRQRISRPCVRSDKPPQPWRAEPRTMQEVKLLGRIHTASEARASIQEAMEAGFTNLSLDFIYGIPGRSLERWREMLAEIVTLGAQHISLYRPHSRRGHADATPGSSWAKFPAPDPDSAASEYELAEEALKIWPVIISTKISNWAKPCFESRHNLAYWRRTPYLGLEVAAHFIPRQQAQSQIRPTSTHICPLCPGENSRHRPPKVISEATALSEAVISACA